MDREKEHKTPAETTLILTKGTNRSDRKEHWNYRSAIVYQCARFCQDPKASHETAVKSVIRYLLTTRKG
eukprot:3811502-Ditylum_brightwellii.AAC.1